jgi:transposase-like protein
MTPAKLRLARAALGKRGTTVVDLCEELGISSQTLYRHVSLEISGLAAPGSSSSAIAGFLPRAWGHG